MGGILRLLDRANWTGGVVTFGDYAWRIGAALSGGALMGWLSSQLTWFWQTFSWFGVASVALLTWFIFVIGLYLLTRRAIVRGLPAVPDVNTTIAPEPAIVEATTPFHENGLYVSSASLEVPKLSDELYFTLHFLIYNATGRTVFIADIDGRMDFKNPADGPDAMGLNLSAPQWRRDSPGLRIKPFTDFLVSMEQRVPPELALTMRDCIEGDKGLRILMDKVNVYLNTDDIDRKIKVPLWSEMVVRRVHDQIQVGRVITGAVKITL